MDARAKLLGHPIHPMLIVLPLGLLVGAIVFGFADWTKIPTGTGAKRVGLRPGAPLPS